MTTTTLTCPDCGCVLDDLTLLGEVLSEDEARAAHTCQPAAHESSEESD